MFKNATSGRPQDCCASRSIELLSIGLLFLKIKSNYSKEKHRELIANFVDKFLRHDGIFILYIISLNAGDLVATDVVSELWEIYTKYYVDSDFRKNTISKSNNAHEKSYV